MFFGPIAKFGQAPGIGNGREVFNFKKVVVRAFLHKSSRKLVIARSDRSFSAFPRYSTGEGRALKIEGAFID